VTFQRADPNTHYRTLRLCSSGARWELGLSPYSGGTRLRMGLAGRPPSVMDFCLGADASLRAAVLAAVLRKLEPVEETAGPKAVDAIFPWTGTRPNLAVHLPALLQEDMALKWKDSPCPQSPCGSIFSLPREIGKIPCSGT